MQPSVFNTCVPFPDRGEAFLMNTLTDAQIVVSSDVVGLLDRLAGSPDDPEDVFSAEEQHTLTELAAHGFVVQDRESERRALEGFFRDIREDTSQLGVTVLTTLQCNFACSYCFQGDHGVSTSAEKMSLQTADHVATWIESRLEEVQPESFSLTFFGGEPLLNLPAMYYLADRLWETTQAQGVAMAIHIITNGLLLTPEVVDRLTPLGLSGVKITLDGDRETHDHMRPLRGGQGTFDRIIENIRRVAGRCRIAIGGNFDEASVDSYPALLDFLKEQEFADSLVQVSFKPIVRETPQPIQSGVLSLTPVGSDGKPLNGTCMSSAGAGGSSPCDTCHFVDEKMSFLREETKKRGFPTLDGVHMGPCEIHKRHAYTIGPNGSLYACPGFTGELSDSIGHVDGRRQPRLDQAAVKFEGLAAWRQCGDCAFIPVCAGGCSVASHTELQDMNTPSCHKGSFEPALVALAHETVRSL
jgi:uncharacterized protein